MYVHEGLHYSQHKFVVVPWPMHSYLKGKSLQTVGQYIFKIKIQSQNTMAWGKLKGLYSQN
jgi:hypothetical protein